MSEDATEPRPFNWPECCAFTQLFRAFKLAIHPTKIILAFAGIFATYMAGRVLDATWANESCAVVSANTHMSELDQFLVGGRSHTKEWISQTQDAKDVRRAGVFSLLMRHARVATNQIAGGVLSLDLGRVLGGIISGPIALTWVVAFHPWYGLFFLVLMFAIWAFFGGAVARVAALHATRDERIGLSAALNFAQAKFVGFFAIPLMPVGIIIFLGVLLMLGGLVASIPAIGELLAGLLFFLALVAGFILAFILIGAVAGFCMTYPTIAVEGSDAFDALSRTFSYVYQRPWRTAVYSLLSIGYGSICFLFVKFFVRLMLWATHLFVGITMNIGSPFLTEATSGPRPGKLDALWTAPSLTGNTPFYGSFDTGAQLSGISWFGQVLIKFWVYGLWGLVAAFVVSLFFSSSTLIYLLLRREVDATDLEEVYVEDSALDDVAATQSAAPAAASQGESGTSLPIIGQNS
ncbi:MAG: hypothetical protein HZA51_05255 [Planctomycetes bacterium]|nr:hypothetical protein [Planctomycetota bacterium]